MWTGTCKTSQTTRTCRGTSFDVNRIAGIAKVFLLCLLLFAGVVCSILSVFLTYGFYQKIARFWHKAVVRTMGVRCQFSGAAPVPGVLVVSNHVSWLDISVIGSQLPVVFLAKGEIANWPVLGFIIKTAGTLFIDRGRGAKDANAKLSESLSKNQAALIFPEATTTDGHSVNRFYPRLMQSAINSNARVQPVALRYSDKNGNSFPEVSYGRNMTFLQSLWQTVCLGRIRVHVQVFELLAPSDSRDRLAREAEVKIRAWVEGGPGVEEESDKQENN